MSGLVHEAIDRFRRRPVQTYEGARAELGGAPWRDAPKSTDAWFILDDEVASVSAQPRRGAWRAGIGVTLIFMAAALVGILTSPRQPPHAAAIVSSEVPAAASPASPPVERAAVATTAAAPDEAVRGTPPAASTPAPRTRPKRKQHASPSHQPHRRSR